MTTQSITTRPDSTPTTVSSTGVKRYHPALVALHWLIAIMIFGAFFLVQENEGSRETLLNRASHRRTSSREIHHRATSLRRGTEASLRRLAFT